MSATPTLENTSADPTIAVPFAPVMLYCDWGVAFFGSAEIFLRFFEESVCIPADTFVFPDPVDDEHPTVTAKRIIEEPGFWLQSDWDVYDETKLIDLLETYRYRSDDKATYFFKLHLAHLNRLRSMNEGSAAVDAFMGRHDHFDALRSESGLLEPTEPDSKFPPVMLLSLRYWTYTLCRTPREFLLYYDAHICPAPGLHPHASKVKNPLKVAQKILDNKEFWNRSLWEAHRESDLLEKVHGQDRDLAFEHYKKLVLFRELLNPSFRLL